VKKLKTSFSKVGAYASEENFIRGDLEGVIEWISGEAKAFEEILNDRGDICAFSGAQGIAAILEKVWCNHVKTIGAGWSYLLHRRYEGSFNRSNFSGLEILFWCLGEWWRELSSEIIKKNEKDTHDTREEAKRVEEATERERRICIVFDFLASVLALWLRTNSLLTTAELSPPPEPYNPLADPEMKEALDIISMANSIIDEVVDKLLNEVAEKVLREE
jgi:hypothetical protein